MSNQERQFTFQEYMTYISTRLQQIQRAFQQLEQLGAAGLLEMPHSHDGHPGIPDLTAKPQDVYVFGQGIPKGTVGVIGSPGVPGPQEEDVQAEPTSGPVEEIAEEEHSHPNTSESEIVDKLVKQGGFDRGLVEKLVQAAKDMPPERAKEMARVAEEAALANVDTTQYLGHFSGHASLWARFMSPKIHKFGRGVILPNFLAKQGQTIKQYKDDITKKVIGEIQTYPTGFYRDESTKNPQFLLQTKNHSVIVEGLPEGALTPFVIDRAGEFATIRQPISALGFRQMEALYKEVEQTLKDLVGM